MSVYMIFWKRRRRLAKIYVCAFSFALLPTQVAFQDLGALLRHQPGIVARAREHLIASPFGTIHAAMFSLPRPLGTAVPHPPIYALANFDPTDIAASIGRQWLGDPTAPLQFPTVNRKDKGDLGLARKRAPLPQLPPMLPIPPVPQSEIDAAFKREAPEPRIDPYAEYEFPAPPDETAAAPDVELPYKDAPPKDIAALAPHAGKGRAADIFFGENPMGVSGGQLAPWAPGEAPVVASAGDPDIKQSALDGGTSADDTPGVSIASKGEVTGVDARPKSPGQRLGLSGETRARAEKCLANAVYFEARGESVRGQIAVAQVVLNRVFSPFYPDKVCAVVYQNAARRNGCQFTFACDGIPDVVTEPDAWARAKHIARDMLDGKLWMPEVAKATHYHAYWVHPDWVAEMTKIYKLGTHTFYRPRAWGDGSDQPTWGDPKFVAQEIAEDERRWPVSYSLEWLRSPDGQAWARENQHK
jgi:spore germination cell wall hydrolase CwlJ-like protein